MPPILCTSTDGNLNKIKSNNPPLSKYGRDFKIDTCNIENISKMLIYSDGLNENSVHDDEEKSYAYYLQDHFLKPGDCIIHI